MKKIPALLCAVVLALTACSSGSNGSDTSGGASSPSCGSAQDCKAKANIKAGVLKGNAGVAGGSKLTEQQAECFADGMVDDVGVDTMKKYQLLNDKLQINPKANPTNMTSSDADATAAVITKCVDMKKLITDQINANAQTKLTATQSKCVSDAIDEDTIRKGLSAAFQGKSSNPMQSLQGSLLKCVTGSSSGQ